MKADFFYSNALGRLILKSMQKMGAFRPAAWFLHTPLSRPMIASFIRKNKIDMTPFEGQHYKSFADFFVREKECCEYEADSEILISPCDGQLSIYRITEGMSLNIKGSHYRLIDLISDEKKAKLFSDGLCLIFRLEASDYHHFCAFDNMQITETNFIPGLLHSVQPIALETFPVFRLNRRWWSIMETDNFGTAAQIEIGAMAVGGVKFTKQSGPLEKGSEMGNFELAGSTIVLLIEKRISNCIDFFPPFHETAETHTEIKVTMGEGLGQINKDT